jgi:hypothetical protein
LPKRDPNNFGVLFVFYPFCGDNLAENVRQNSLKLTFA